MWNAVYTNTFTCTSVCIHTPKHLNQPMGVIKHVFLRQLLALTFSHFYCPSVSYILFSVIHSSSPSNSSITFVPLPCVSSAEETMYHSTLFWYHDEWGESVPVDCGLEIKNKQMKLSPCLAAPSSPLPPCLMLIWLRMLTHTPLLQGKWRMPSWLQ